MAKIQNLKFHNYFSTFGTHSLQQYVCMIFFSESGVCFQLEDMSLENTLM